MEINWRKTSPILVWHNPCYWAEWDGEAVYIISQLYLLLHISAGFKRTLKVIPDGSAGKESTYNAGNTEDVGFTPESGRSLGRGNGKPLQYSCLKNLMNRGAWWAIVQSVAKSCTYDWTTKHIWKSGKKLTAENGKVVTSRREEIRVMTQSI